MISKTAQFCVADNQYWIHGDVYDVTEWRYTGFNGLVASIAAPGVLRDPGDFAIVMTGTETGPVSATVQAAAREPGPANLDAWDEVVEVSLMLPGENPAVVTDFDDDESSSLPAFTVLGPGPYRVRVHARGRDAGQEALMVDDEPVEEHLIQVWPAPAAPTHVIKTSDTYGTTFRPQN
ncbi:hypothetical protein ACWC3Y_30610 [Streptomyces sp. NPDC001296]